MAQRWLTIVVSLWVATATLARERPDTALINRVFRYAATVDTAGLGGQTSYAYTKATFRIDRKNPTLMLVPSIYAIARRGKQEYITESYQQMTFHHAHDYTSKELLWVTTVPHRKHTLTGILRYLTPTIYDETMIDQDVLSPFHRANQKFYHYRVTFLLDGTARINFSPRRNNTQMVSGNALVDYYSGRVIFCHIEGEFDMVNFWIDITMGPEGLQSLYPMRCDARMRFRFIRSKVSGHYTACYGLPKVLKDSIVNDNDPVKMALVRPDTLTAAERQLYARQFEQQRQSDSARVANPQKKNWTKRILWDALGNNMLNRVKSKFGINNQGYIRLNPILNPLYMGYDHHRGFIYKIDLRASYQFSANSEISARLKAGYAMKQHQLYFRLPIYYYINKRHNDYLKLEIGNGSHIRSIAIRRAIEAQPQLPGNQFPTNNLLDYLNEFKQLDSRLIFNHDFNDYLGFQVGTLFQQKTAINKEAFRMAGLPTDYRLWAPVAELQYRPLGWHGPIITIDYDHGFKGVMKSTAEYERWEGNIEYIHRLDRLRSWQLRLGAGCYTHRGRKAYFLNYENFQENNIPGGWNDDWSGEFECLRSDTYNYSDHYVRANATYESPMLVLSWLPLVGHYIEMERIYVSSLEAEALHPYLEFGYGFRTRWLSAGIFTSNGKGNRTLGIKVGFELFRDW